MKKLLMALAVTSFTSFSANAVDISRQIIVDDSDARFAAKLTATNSDIDGETVTHDARIKIARPNINGVSLSRFEEFGIDFEADPSLGEEGALILHNHHKAALVILEVTGDKSSYVNSSNFNFRSNNADVIFLNKNGYDIRSFPTNFLSFTTASEFEASDILDVENFEPIPHQHHHHHQIVKDTK